MVWYFPSTLIILTHPIRCSLQPNDDTRFSEPTVGKVLLKARSMYTEDHVFWLCVVALFAFSFIFNFGFILALTYLNRKSQIVCTIYSFIIVFWFWSNLVRKMQHLEILGQLFQMMTEVRKRSKRSGVHQFQLQWLKVKTLASIHFSWLQLLFVQNDYFYKVR